MIPLDQVQLYRCINGHRDLNADCSLLFFKPAEAAPKRAERAAPLPFLEEKKSPVPAQAPTVGTWSRSRLPISNYDSFWSDLSAIIKY